jgi:uncharacterized protein
MTGTQPPDAWLGDGEAAALYAGGDAAHDFDHVRRVTRLAVHIAQAEGADVTVVRLAALLHDVPVNAPREGHHRAAAVYARDLLSGRGLDAPRVAAVVHAIEAHRFREPSISPQTLEAQCLYDADKLDSIGALGVARAFAYAGSHAARLWTLPWRAIAADVPPPADVDYTPVHEYVYKLRRILATLHTPTARRMGEARHRFMVEFFDRLDAEVEELV